MFYSILSPPWSFLSLIISKTVLPKVPDDLYNIKTKFLFHCPSTNSILLVFILRSVRLKVFWIPHKYCLQSVSKWNYSLMAFFAGPSLAYQYTPQILNLAYWYVFPLNTHQIWSQPLSSFPQNIKGSWRKIGILHTDIFPDGLCDTYVTLICITHYLNIPPSNSTCPKLRYFHPSPLYSSDHPKKKAAKLTCYLITVPPTTLSSLWILNISSRLLTPTTSTLNSGFIQFLPVLFQ